MVENRDGVAIFSKQRVNILTMNGPNPIWREIGGLPGLPIRWFWGNGYSSGRFFRDELTGKSSMK
jgi:hypothetical protein